MAHEEAIAKRPKALSDFVAAYQQSWLAIHRSVEIAFGKGQTDMFSCPYHGWTYKLDGSLAGASMVGMEAAIHHVLEDYLNRIGIAAEQG